jgi:hypothetical protein
MTGVYKTGWISLGSWNEDPTDLADSVIRSLLPLPQNVIDSRQMRLYWEESLLSDGWVKGLAVNKSKLKIGYVSHDVGMCIQLGNTSRVYADLLKLETCFRLGAIKKAILVVPSDDYSLSLGTNYAAFTRTELDIKALSPTLSVPIILISIDNRRGK